MCGRALGEIDCEVLRATRALRRALGEIDCEVLPQGGGLSRAALGGEEIGRGRFFRGSYRFFGFTGQGGTPQNRKAKTGHKQDHLLDALQILPHLTQDQLKSLVETINTRWLR